MPVLSTTSVSIFSISSSASAFLTSTPAVAPRPVPTMIDIGVARPSAQGQAMISTATALTSAWASRGSGPTRFQTTKATTATSTTAGTNQAETLSASAWIGARERCASATMRTICDSIVSRPTRSARISRLPVPLTVAPVTLLAGHLLDRHRLAADHRFIDRAVALDHDAVDRHLLAGPDAKQVADMDMLQRDVLLAAVVADPPRGLRRETEQGADRRAGRRAGAQLQHLAEQHQRRDDRRRLEIDRHQPAHRAERRRENLRGAAVATRL